MTNIEIASWLRGLEPDDPEQEAKIKEAILLFLKNGPAKKLTSADIYVKSLNYENVYMKRTTEMYANYKKYCAENNLKCECQIILSIAIKDYFLLKSKVIRDCDKTFRIYVACE